MNVIKKTFISLRNRNYRLYFSGQLVSNTGNWLTNVAITLLVLKITNSGLAVGLLAACQYGPILLMSAWAGSLADRWDKRKALLITQTLEMLQSASLAFAAFMPHPSLTLLYILAAIGGIFLAFDNPVRRSFVSEMVPKEDLPNAIVLYSTIVNVSRVFGPALAGLLVVTLGYGWCFTLDATSYLFVIAALLMMVSSQLYKIKPAEKTTSAVRDGFKYIASQPNLWISFVMMAIIGTLAYNFTVTLPLFVIKGLHSTDVVFTILYSILSVGSVACALVMAHRGKVKINHIIFGAAALGFVMVALSFAKSVAVSVPIVFLLGVAMILYSNSTTTLVQVETNPQMLARVLAIQAVLLIGTTPIGGPLSGWLADATNARIPILIGGLVCVVAAIFGFTANKLSKRQSEMHNS